MLARIKRVAGAIKEAWPNPPKLYRIPEQYMKNPNPLAKATIIRLDDLKDWQDLRDAWSRAEADGAITEVN